MSIQKQIVTIETYIKKDQQKNIGKITQKLAEKQIENIINRTQSGHDLYGKRFKSYSLKYLKFKKRKGVYSGVVDLTLEDQMLRSLTAKRTKNGSLIYFNDQFSNDKAYWHNEGIGSMPKREFFGINKEEKEELTELAKSLLERA